MKESKFKVGAVLHMTRKFKDHYDISDPYRSKTVKVTDVYEENGRTVVQLNHYSDAFTMTGAFDFDGNFTYLSTGEEIIVEEKILEASSVIWDDFLSLSQTHPQDVKDFAKAIGDVQKIIAVRMARRYEPKLFPTHTN